MEEMKFFDKDNTAHNSNTPCSRNTQQLSKNFSKAPTVNYVPPHLEDFSLEVWWKNRLTAKVHSEGTKVYVESIEKNPMKRLFPNMTLSRYQASEVLKMRCWDPGRPDIRELLAACGLTKYVPLDIVKKTHGVSYNDFLWIKFPGEDLRAEDVLVRTDWSNDDND